MTTKAAAEEPIDPLQERNDAAEHLARLIAGNDDERFIVVFGSLVNVIDRLGAPAPEPARTTGRSLRPESAAPRVAPARSARRGTSRRTGAPAGSIYADPVFLANAKRLITDRTRIVGGIATSAYRDCVAIGSAQEWCCTGTLVARNVVVTAGHCHGACMDRVFVGDNVERRRRGTVIEVAGAERHPEYSADPWANDLAVLVLAKDAKVRPRALAPEGVLEAAQTIRLAGYGNTDEHGTAGYGIRRIVDVPLASSDPRYGADADTEFVAGAPFLDRDSCSGDSGGPAYVRDGNEWYLAGATSRATDSAIRTCGDGGIYTRLLAFEEWIKSVPGGRWD